MNLDDFQMPESFFQDLALPEPDHYLGVGSDSHANQTTKIMLAFEPRKLSTRMRHSRSQFSVQRPAPSGSCQRSH